ncbi:hypothetical protein [Jejuia spongiicola]|uniref:Response regulatory domain-containing protein n=1 Tax=Jejuia spongiicola TaxID=2942207 RepID=A0ABT0QC22_9FLAO|nr:hypothetical protein [Jejuia spongiicola]MCL6294521.1 hypothetical protein [Jejuia spongiicola]
MQIVLAHSDKEYVEQLKIFFFKNGFTDIHIFYDGFEVLRHIIKNRNQLVIVEEELPGLNAADIKTALVFKRIRSKFLILGSKDEIGQKAGIVQSISYSMSKDLSAKKIFSKLKTELKLHDVG